MHPLKTAWTRSHGVVVVTVIWITSILTSAYHFTGSHADAFEWGTGTYYDCKETYDPRIVTPLVFLFTFLFPLVIMTFCYIMICLKLRRGEFSGILAEKKDRLQNRKKIKVPNF